jgi:cytochrome P450
MTDITSPGEQVTLDGDPFSQEILSDPIPFDRLVRETAPLVHLKEHGVWATGRHAEAEAAFRDWGTFSSAYGTGITNIRRQENWREPSVILEVDPPEHSRTRAVMSRVLSPATVAKLRDRFRAEAETMVGALLERREFDATKDLAEAFPLKVLPDAVGMAEEGREHLLPYANLNFQAMGPRNGLYEEAVAHAGRAPEHVAWQMRREALAPEGIGAEIYAAADAGKITDHEAAMLVRSFLSAGVDTTVFGLGFALHALAVHPEQWDLLRKDPALARHAFEETLRWKAPSPIIGRTTRTPTEFGGVRLGAQEKVLLFLGAANRDPRRWENPDAFDITRRTAGHLAFGVGIHGCVGQMMARLEAESVLGAVARLVRRIELTAAPRIKYSNWLRGFTELPVRVEAA